MSSIPFLLRLLAAVAVLTASARGSRDGDAQMSLSGDDYVCEHPPYKIHMVSKSPRVIYITDFLTPSERAHLRAITKHSFAHSAVTDGRGGGGQQVHGVRTSQSTNVPRDAVVRCLEARALAFQGLDTAAAQLEPLQLVRYGRGERYHFHTDWFPDPARATAALGGNRLSSFFAYVRASNGTTAGSGPDGDDDSGGGGAGSDERVRGGGTNFPLVDAPRDPRWCDAWVDCDEPWDRGVTFRPVEGNAVYWENMLPDAPGRGDPRTLHAGLPLVSGEKIGLNIWTRQAPLGDDVRGPDV